MFSDFQNRVVGVPQIAPVFGVGSGNMIFDGPGKDEDFGLEQVTGNPVDRYKFRTSPLRNVALQPTFFHNGAFTRLSDAVDFHLDPLRHAPAYDPKRAGIDKDLRLRLGPIAPVLERLDPWLLAPVELTRRERHDLLAFLRRGLTDPRAMRSALCDLLPRSVPSGLPTMRFERCPTPR
jgi:cytochrome c peroxidase